MVYLTYTKKFQEDVIKCKESGMKVCEITKIYDISIYTLYKILHLNNKPPTLSQATKDNGFVEGAEHRELSSNNNILHERPTSTWDYKSCRHKKIKHTCLNCGKCFYARPRGDRTKFCSKKCKSDYQSKINSTVLICDKCNKPFCVKNSQKNNFIHCKECRNFKLGSQSSKISREIGKWLREEFEVVETEKTFSWFYDTNKPKGRFKLDYYLPLYKLGIEYDGEQHFKPSFTNLWESVSCVQYRDALKTKLCLQHDIKIIRFKYVDIITKEYVLMKIYAELQGNQLVEVKDKKLSR